MNIRYRFFQLFSISSTFRPSEIYFLKKFKLSSSYHALTNPNSLSASEILNLSQKKHSALIPKNMLNSLNSLSFKPRDWDPNDKKFLSLLQDIKNKLLSYSNHELITIIQSLDRLEIVDRNLIYNIVTLAHHRIDQFSSTEISNLLFSLSNLKYPCAELFQQAAKVFNPLLTNFSFNDLKIIISAYHQANILNSDFFQKAEDIVLKNFKDIPMSILSSLIYSFTHSNFKINEILTIVSNLPPQITKTCSLDDILLIQKSFSYANFPAQQLFSTFSEILQKHINQLDHSYFSKIIQTYVYQKHAFQNNEFLHNALQLSEKYLPLFKIPPLPPLLPEKKRLPPYLYVFIPPIFFIWASFHLAEPYLLFMSPLIGFFTFNILWRPEPPIPIPPFQYPENDSWFTPAEVSSVVHSFGELTISSPSFSTKISHLSQAVIERMKSNELAQITSGMKHNKLNCYCDGTINLKDKNQNECEINLFYQRTSLVILNQIQSEKFSPESICQILKSFALARVKSLPLLNRLGNIAIKMIEILNSKQLVDIIFSYAFLFQKMNIVSTLIERSHIFLDHSLDFNYLIKLIWSLGVFSYIDKFHDLINDLLNQYFLQNSSLNKGITINRSLEPYIIPVFLILKQHNIVFPKYIKQFEDKKYLMAYQQSFQSSSIVSEIFRSFLSLQVKCHKDYYLECINKNVDIYIEQIPNANKEYKNVNLVVNIQDPSHFIHSSQDVLGKYILFCKMIKQNQYQIMDIPFWEWKTMKLNENNLSYIPNHLSYLLERLYMYI